MDFLTVLGIIDSKQLDVFIYIVENTSQRQYVHRHLLQDSEGCGRVPPDHCNHHEEIAGEQLYQKGSKNGVWLVNPNILMRVMIPRNKSCYRTMKARSQLSRCQQNKEERD